MIERVISTFENNIGFYLIIEKSVRSNKNNWEAYQEHYQDEYEWAQDKYWAKIKGKGVFTIEFKTSIILVPTFLENLLNYWETNEGHSSSVGSVNCNNIERLHSAGV